ncbi:single-stranded DNA-binding protein [Streptosporangium sp. NBC_01469]
MDRNEVILVGRLPEAAHIRSLQSGSTLGTWRLIVRRRHHGRGARVDTIPCASFETEVIEAVTGWLPDDIVEVTGSLRRRWWGSEGAKSSGYEVEVRSVRRLERKVTMILTGDEGGPVPAPPRSVHSLLHARKGAAGLQTGEGSARQGGEPRITPARPGLTSVPDLTTSAGPDPTPVGLDLAPVGLRLP